jgi:diguanylate cyclase (GGDEF)-like protein
MIEWRHRTFRDCLALTLLTVTSTGEPSEVIAMTVFVPALWIAAGISLFAGIHFLFTGLARRQERAFFAFGLLCLLLTAYMVSSALWYKAASVEEVARIARVEMALICLIYPTFVWFLELYSEFRRVLVPVLVTALPFGALLVVNLWSPLSFLYSGISPTDPIILPWGERLSAFSLRTSAYAPFYYAATYGVFAWAIYRCLVLWRRGQRGKAWPVMAYLLIQFATVVHGELIDNLQLSSVYLGEFAFLALVVLMSRALGLELRQRTLALETSLTELHAETERRREVEARLRHMAYHDHLTDLPNRRKLLEYLEEAQSRSRESGRHGALLLIDLDRFKTINDSLGHEIGDALLQAIAEQLRAALPHGGRPTRLGGDEFAVVLDGLDPGRNEAESQALRVAHTLVERINQPFAIGDHELVVGASIGVALFPGDEDVIMRQADMALYRAKAAGGSSVQLFAPRMQSEVDERLSLEKGLRAALDHGELALHFQPQVDAAGRMIGAEALLRWQHPQRGAISPTHFIPIAEETGLIHPIGDYVLSAACERLRAWRQDGVPRSSRLAINVSPWQLDSTEFIEKIKSVGSQSGIDASRLTLEITESSFLDDIDSVAGRLHTLTEAGVELSIDDFGTGYSSLAWLKKLPLHELKIDRLFVRDMDAEHNGKLVETIIAIARHMGLRVIAEGVETDSQYNTLADMGCQAFQGYLIAPPLDAVAFGNWMKAQTRRAANNLFRQ